MKSPMCVKRTWGLRFSASDAAVIGIFIAAAFVLRRMENPLWWMLGIVAGHFFLFCNILRARRRLELWWSGLFLVNFVFWFWLGKLDWLHVFTAQMPITAGVALIETQSSRYHGIFAKQANPRLNDYLEGRIP